MASSSHSADNSEQDTPSQETLSAVFIPKDTLDQPCDIVLVVKDGEFKAHRQVLSEASPFFEKLLNNDMKESKEGVVRLEIFTESVMRNTLEFIYTGHVQILDEDDARDLVVIADYLFLHNLKSFAVHVLLQKLNTSNCISTFRVADVYHCEELVLKTKNLIFSNFTTLFAANREDVLKMSNKELTMCISSDELHVSAEEDVFNIILAWINHDESNRNKYFAELFRHVRLVYVSRDFLCSDVVTNDLVKDNEGCLYLVKEAINVIDTKNFDNLPHNLHDTPRKSLESSVLVTYRGKYIMCYFPRENRWYTLGEMRSPLGEMPSELRNCRLLSCNGKLYNTTAELVIPLRHQRTWRLHTSCYNPYSNTWTSLPSLEENRYLRQIFVNNEDEMYALFSEQCLREHICGWRIRHRKRASRHFGRFCSKEESREKHVSFITKYKPESNSWEDISSSDYLDLRDDFCIVAHDNFIYFIGGVEWFADECKFLSDVDRYDISRNQWDKLASIQIARKWARGSAANGKIIIAGGVQKGGYVNQCEMYNEETNEWHLIQRFNKGRYLKTTFLNLLTVDGQLYALNENEVIRNKNYLQFQTVECFNPEKNEWNLKTNKTVPVGFELDGCSMRIFKGCLNDFQLKSFISGNTQARSSYY